MTVSKFSGCENIGFCKGAEEQANAPNNRGEKIEGK